MVHATNTQEVLLQNLKDAGCSQQMIESCVALFQQKNTSEMKRLLVGHRQNRQSMPFQNSALKRWA